MASQLRAVWGSPARSLGRPLQMGDATILAIWPAEVAAPGTKAMKKRQPLSLAAKRTKARRVQEQEKERKAKELKRTKPTLAFDRNRDAKRGE